MLSYISYSWGQKFPFLFMIYPKIYLSARGDLSENRILLFCFLVAYFQSKVLECKALSWKVKPHLLGSSQYFSKMLTPPTFSQRSTGYLIVQTFKHPRSVDLPAPRFPSIETTPDIQFYIPLYSNQKIIDKFQILFIYRLTVIQKGPMQQKTIGDKLYTPAFIKYSKSKRKSYNKIVNS